MKHIKTIGSILLCFLLIGCESTNSPSISFQQFIIAYKSQDQVTMNLHTTTPLILFRSESDNQDELSQLTKRIYDKLLNFDYGITSEEINNNAAILTVQLTTYDFKEVLERGVAITNEEIRNSIEDENFDSEKIYINNFRYLDEAQKNVVVTIEIHLERTNGKWLIINPQTLEEAIANNYLEAIQLIQFQP